MEVIRFAYPFSPGQVDIPDRGQILALGFFDGVHLGHQELLRTTVELSRLLALPASVLTFDPHPREVLRARHHAKYITPLAEKLRCFRDFGLDQTYVLRFDRELSQLSPRQFIDEVIIALKAQTVVVGFNFTFGHLGQGTAETLREEAAGRYRVTVIKPFHEQGERVSSTLIRELMHDGNIERVNELLGRPYRIVGQVVAGEGRGRKIGVPTANLRLHEPYFLPARGVYAVCAHVNGKTYGGVMNIGMKPTFRDEDGELTVEVHLFDYAGDLYGSELELELFAHLRPERKFPSAEALVQQIEKDMENAKGVLTSNCRLTRRN